VLFVCPLVSGSHEEHRRISNCAVARNNHQNRMRSPPNTYPHLLQIVHRRRINGISMLRVCGGAILSEHVGLTAAHCLMGEPREFEVYSDAQSISRGKKHRISKIFPHYLFNESDYYSPDLAIFTLANGIHLGPRARPICLPPDISHVLPGTIMEIAGWGIEYEGDTTMLLRNHKLEKQNLYTCQNYYKDFHPAYSFCVGQVGDPDICEGDSGSPLWTAERGVHVVHGLVSSSFEGKQCGMRQGPSLCTRVANFRTWILNIVRL
ncbi:hypothetical protein PMAYCL1PPCAC_25947, partial [Pristionchus mayeri]